MPSNAVGSIATWHFRFNAAMAYPTEFSAGSVGFVSPEERLLDEFPVRSDAMGNLKIGVEIH